MSDGEPDIKSRTNPSVVFAIEGKVLWRGIILLLLVMSLFGPWAYDRIHVPAEYACNDPFVRLEGDFCGLPMSWFSWFLLFVGDFFYILRQLITGTFTGRGRELLGVFIVTLPILPLFSSLLLQKKKAPSRLQGFHLIAWGLGCIFPLFILFAQQNVEILLLWGPGLYILVAVGAVIFEILLMKTAPVKIE